MIASGMTILILALFPIWIGLVARVLYNNRIKNTITSEQFNDQYGTLIEGLNVKNYFGVYWNVYILIRWAVTMIVLV